MAGMAGLTGVEQETCNANQINGLRSPSIAAVRDPDGPHATPPDSSAHQRRRHARRVQHFVIRPRLALEARAAVLRLGAAAASMSMAFRVSTTRCGRWTVCASLTFMRSSAPPKSSHRGRTSTTLPGAPPWCAPPSAPHNLTAFFGELAEGAGFEPAGGY